MIHNLQLKLNSDFVSLQHLSQDAKHQQLTRASFQFHYAILHVQNYHRILTIHHPEIDSNFNEFSLKLIQIFYLPRFRFISHSNESFFWNFES